MTWTREMNITVMRCYYTVTKLETVMIGYRPELHRLFALKYPELTQAVTPQRLVDQKRVILANRKLSEREIQNIKEEVAAEISSPNTDDDLDENHHQAMSSATASHSEPKTPENTTAITPTPSPIPTTHNLDKINIINCEIETNIIKYQGLNPVNWTPLPKLMFKKDTNDIINTVNLQLEQHICVTSTLEDLHLLVYAAATTVITLNKQLTENRTNHKRENYKPKWQIRLENKINTIRGDLGRLTQFCRGNQTKQIKNRLKHILNRDNNETPVEALDTLKQKLAVYTTRLKRYLQSNERKTQNMQFGRNEKQFYKTLEKQTESEIIPPKIEEIKDFWESIWSHPKHHKETATWTTEEQKKYQHIPVQADHNISTEELKKVIQKIQAWKAPGVDHIHNFWYKRFTSIHEHLTTQINKIILEPNKLPQFLTQGKTYIKPKNSDTQNPANYRPLTCLPTLYKIITSLITHKIEKHLTQNNILTEEQKGCRKKCQGCKEQLIIDSVVMKQVEKQQRNISSCYIDYQKAFDSIPHSWLLKVLDIYKIDPYIKKFLYMVMQTWRTTIQLNTNKIKIEINNIQIKRGIFQGDSLSALWFCLSLNPLSNILNNTTYGFKIKCRNNSEFKINHLLYMDDIKIYAPNQTQMQSLLNLTAQFTQDTCMKFGMDKCRMLNIQRGKHIQQNHTETLHNEILKNMEPQETYKYLGFEQNTSINHTHIKQQLKKKYKHRLTLLVKSSLNAKNTIKAINTYAVPVLTYSFGIIKWTNTDLEELNRLNRTKLTEQRKHHPNACTERITLSRKEGGRGLIDLLILHNKQIKNLRQYFQTKNTPLHQAITEADKEYTPLDLHTHDTHENEIVNVNPTQLKKDTWARKALHGSHYNIMQNPQIDTQLSYKWLTVGQLFPETEGFVIAIQDRVIATKNYRKYIIKENIDSDKCRKCLQFPETIEHITGGCKILAGTEYTERHNTAAKIIHQTLALKHGLLKAETKYYLYTPENILENEKYKMYWDRTILTDKTIICNRPDITLVDKIEKHTYLVDISIPNDNNITTKETEKIEKYTPLAIELEELWKQVKVTVVPIVISVTGITTKSFTQHLKTLKLPLDIHTTTQKAVILKTSSIVRKFLQ